MKTFDEYIQGRIMKIRNNIPHVFIKYSLFSQLTFQFSGIVNRIMTASEVAEVIVGWGGVGKGRAKDYAHYIVAYIAEQENKKQDALLREQIDRHSHLTDEDSKHIKNLAMEIVRFGHVCPTPAEVERYESLRVELFDFINSLKGDNNG